MRIRWRSTTHDPRPMRPMRPTPAPHPVPTARSSATTRVTSRRALRRGRASARIPLRFLRGLTGSAAFVFLALAIVATAAAMALAAHSVPHSAAAGTGAGAGPNGSQSGGRQTTGVTVTCGAPGQAACSSQPSAWIPLRSNASADILAAARQSTLFAENRSDTGDHAHDLTHLGGPVFVQAMQPGGTTAPSGAAAGAVWPDFYVIPILDIQGNTTDAAEAQLNPAHTALHVVAIVTYTHPRPAGTVTAVAMADAVAAVAAQAHTTVRAGSQPRLVYVPIDAAAQEIGKIVWTAGGESPADPLWLIPGADGHDRVAGTDARLYTSAQLPVMQPVGR